MSGKAFWGAMWLLSGLAVLVSAAAAGFEVYQWATERWSDTAVLLALFLASMAMFLKASIARSRIASRERARQEINND